MEPPYSKEFLCVCLAALKWSTNRPCYACGAADFYYLKNRSRKCKHCKAAESPTAHTAFHRQNIDIDKAMDILLSIQHKMDTSSEPFLSPLAHVPGDFGIPQPTLYKFLKRLHNWLPTAFHLPGSFTPPDLLYNSVRHPAVYYSLYHLLFEDWGSKRSPAEIVSLLAIKEIRPIALTDFYRFLHETDIANWKYDKRGFYTKGQRRKNKRTYLD
jgi:hypothetical protein